MNNMISSGMHGTDVHNDYVRGLQHELYFALHVYFFYHNGLTLSPVDDNEKYNADFFVNEKDRKIYIDVKQDNSFMQTNNVLFELYANKSERKIGWGLRYIKHLINNPDIEHRIFFIDSACQKLLKVNTNKLVDYMKQQLSITQAENGFTMSTRALQHRLVNGVKGNKECCVILLEREDMIHKGICMPVAHLPYPFERIKSIIDWNAPEDELTRYLHYYYKKLFTEYYVTEDDLQKNPGILYLFGDNLEQKGMGGMAKIMRGKANAFGIPTKKKPANTPDSFFTDDELMQNKKWIDDAFDRMPYYEKCFIPRGIGCGLSELHRRAPKTFYYLKKRLMELAIGEWEPQKDRQVYLEVVEERQDKTVEQKAEPEEIKTLPKGDMVHLHVHSTFSLLDAVSSPEDIAEAVYDLKHHAVALTDHGYMFGNFKFQQACNKYGLKAIHGVESYFTETITQGKDTVTYHLILLAMNREGWRNLCTINTLAGKEGFYRKPRIDWDILAKYNEGIICTSACYAGPVSFHVVEEGRDIDLARTHMLQLKAIFGDRFYNEIMNIGWEPYDNITGELVELANSEGIKTIATNDTHYAKKEDIKTKELMMKIAGWEYEAGQLYLKSSDEMLKGSVTREHLDNTLEIDDRIEFDMNKLFNGYIFPAYDITKDENYKKFLEKDLQK